MAHYTLELQIAYSIDLRLIGQVRAQNIREDVAHLFCVISKIVKTAPRHCGGSLQSSVYTKLRKLSCVSQHQSFWKNYESYKNGAYRLRYAPFLVVTLKFFTYRQQEYADNNDADKDVGFPGKLFFQENARK